MVILQVLRFLNYFLTIIYVFILNDGFFLICWVIFLSVFTALKENLYYEAGKMLAISLVHGGPSPGFFSETLFNCLVYGPENTLPVLDDVSDFEVTQIIFKVKKKKRFVY